MNYIEVFNKVTKIAKDMDLSLTIEIKRNRDIEVWVYSYQFSTGKFITLQELADIDKIDFKEMAINDKVRDSVEKLMAFGYSKDEIEERFATAIHEEFKEVLVG